MLLMNVIEMAEKNPSDFAIFIFDQFFESFAVCCQNCRGFGWTIPAKR